MRNFIWLDNLEPYATPLPQANLQWATAYDSNNHSSKSQIYLALQTAKFNQFSDQVKLTTICINNFFLQIYKISIQITMQKTLQISHIHSGLLPNKIQMGFRLCWLPWHQISKLKLETSIQLISNAACSFQC